MSVPPTQKILIMISSMNVHLWQTHCVLTKLIVPNQLGFLFFSRRSVIGHNRGVASINRFAAF